MCARSLCVRRILTEKFDGFRAIWDGEEFLLKPTVSGEGGERDRERGRENREWEKETETVREESRVEKQDRGERERDTERGRRREGKTSCLIFDCQDWKSRGSHKLHPPKWYRDQLPNILLDGELWCGYDTVKDLRQMILNEVCYQSHSHPIITFAFSHFHSHSLSLSHSHSYSLSHSDSYSYSHS